MIYLSGERLHPHHIRTADFDRRWRVSTRTRCTTTSTGRPTRSTGCTGS